MLLSPIRVTNQKHENRTKRKTQKANMNPTQLSSAEELRIGETTGEEYRIELPRISKSHENVAFYLQQTLADVANHFPRPPNSS